VGSLTAGCPLGEEETKTEMRALQRRPSSARSETVVVAQVPPSRIHADTAQSLFELSPVLGVKRPNKEPNFLALEQVDLTEKLV